MKSRCPAFGAGKVVVEVAVSRRPKATIQQKSRSERGTNVENSGIFDGDRNIVLDAPPRSSALPKCFPARVQGLGRNFATGRPTASASSLGQNPGRARIRPCPAKASPLCSPWKARTGTDQGACPEAGGRRRWARPADRGGTRNQFERRQPGVRQPGRPSGPPPPPAWGRRPGPRPGRRGKGLDHRRRDDAQSALGADEPGFQVVTGVVACAVPPGMPSIRRAGGDHPPAPRWFAGIADIAWASTGVGGQGCRRSGSCLGRQDKEKARPRGRRLDAKVQPASTVRGCCWRRRRRMAVSRPRDDDGGTAAGQRWRRRTEASVAAAGDDGGHAGRSASGDRSRSAVVQAGRCSGQRRGSSHASR